MSGSSGEWNDQRIQKYYEHLNQARSKSQTKGNINNNQIQFGKGANPPNELFAQTAKAESDILNMLPKLPNDPVEVINQGG